MYSSTHHAGMPLNHLVSSGSDRYWTYQQKNGIRKMKPFNEEYFKLAPKGKNYIVKGYLVNSDGSMVHVDKNNNVTFYKDMTPQQKTKAEKFKKFNEKIKNKLKDQKPVESKEQTKPQEQTKPKVDPNDFYQRVFFPPKYKFLNWNPEVKKYFIERNKKNGQFCFQEIKQDIKKDMPEGAVKWFETRKNHLLEIQKKTQGDQAQSQQLKKKTSAVSTNLDLEEVTKLKQKVEKIEIIKKLNNTIEQLQQNDKKWPNTKPTQFFQLLELFFFQYDNSTGLFDKRDDSLEIRGKLINFRKIVQETIQEFGEDDELKAFSCYIREEPLSFETINGMKGTDVSVMTKNLIRALQDLKSGLFRLLLAHEKQKMQKNKKERLQSSAASSLGLERNASIEEITKVVEEKISSSDQSKNHLAVSVLFFYLTELYVKMPLKMGERNIYDISNMQIMAFILKNFNHLPLNFVSDCITITPQCNECLNEIKRRSRLLNSQPNIYEQSALFNPVKNE